MVLGHLEFNLELVDFTFEAAQEVYVSGKLDDQTVETVKEGFQFQDVQTLLWEAVLEGLLFQEAQTLLWRLSRKVFVPRLCSRDFPGRFLFLDFALETVQEGFQFQEVESGYGGEPALLQAGRLEAEDLDALHQVLLHFLEKKNFISLRNHLSARLETCLISTIYIIVIPT